MTGIYSCKLSTEMRIFLVEIAFKDLHHAYLARRLNCGGVVRRLPIREPTIIEACLRLLYRAVWQLP